MIAHAPLAAAQLARDARMAGRWVEARELQALATCGDVADGRHDDGAEDW